MIYTVLITGVYLIGAYVNSAWLPSPSAVAALLVLSLWIGASLSFLFSDALVSALRIVLHFLATGAVFWLTFGVWSGYLRRGGSGVLILVLYTVLYAIIGGVTALLRQLKSGSDTRSKPYQSMMKGKDAEYRSQFSSGESDRKGGR